MANIEKRVSKDGKTSYRVKVRLRGHPVQSATFDRKTDAAKWAQSTESAIRENRHFKTTEGKRHTVAELINRYIRDVLPRTPKSERDQLRQLEWWKSELGSYTLADVTPALIAQARDNLSKGITQHGKP